MKASVFRHWPVTRAYSPEQTTRFTGGHDFVVGKVLLLSYNGVEGDKVMSETKDYNDKKKMYDIMNTTQSNYSNMLKRLQSRKSFSNFVITYYSIALIVYSLTAEFFPEVFDVKLSSYFNIILSIVVLTYSLIITNAKYSERIQGQKGY